jgi:cell surface hyaluronidase
MNRFLLPILMAIVIADLSTAPAAEVVAVASGHWSSATTWGGLLPGVEDDVKIPSGLTVTLNTNVECGGILVEGRLEVQRTNLTLLCDTLLVQGLNAVFQVGTSSNRFLQNFVLTLKGLSNEPALVMGSKVLGAHNGGTLDIHGRDRIEWTRLGVNAAAGATSLTLIEPVDWVVGDSILVTSSRASWNEAETRTITAVSADMRTVSFTPGLTYLHSGSTITRTRSSDGKSWTGDLRAEVGLLSRNVKIQGDAASETAGFGGHIMVMNGGVTCCVTNGRSFIEGVELYRMGQKSALGRYPMHWHMVAEGGVGQYFRDSVVRRSFNRAITIHGTESTLVENNFCYDHLGNGLFLEDGSERFNVIRRNVVALSKKPAAGEELLETDNGFNAPQNRSPSSYWITNPNNTFTDNVAAGTEGTGFWFAFPRQPLNASLTHPRFAGLEPHKQPLGAFDRNSAHSSKMGLDINDQVNADDTLAANGEWANNGPFYFNDCTWYCNDNAIYAGIGGERKNVVYRNHVFSDNEINLFLATYQLCEESLMVADSGFGLQPSGTTRTVYAVYDGAGRMKRNHLVGYHATNARFLQNIGAAIKHPNHYFESLTFDPPTPVRSVLTDYNLIPPPNVDANGPGHPRIWAQVIVDVDGSISGVTNSSLVSNHPFLLTGGETRPSVWTYMYRSDHRFAQCRLEYGIPFGSIPNVSVVRTKAGTPSRGVYYINGYNEWHQLPFIVREDFLYTCYYEALPSTRRVVVNLDDAVVGDHYVVCFKNFGKLPGIAVSGMTSRASLAALKSGSTSGFFKETNGDFYIRPVATASQHSFTITWTSDIALPVVDSDGDGTSDGAEAAAGTDPFRTVNGTEPFVNSEFDVPGNFEEWMFFSGIGSEAVTGGVLSAQSTNGDAQMSTDNLRVDGTAVPYLQVRMRASQAGTAQIFWGRLGAGGFSGSRVVSATYSGGSEWQLLSFPMLNHADWQGQVITELRFDPVSTSGVTFEIDWIRASDGVVPGTVPLVNAGAVWKFNDTGANLGTAWRNNNFNDAAWPSGPGQFGFGDGDEATLVTSNRQITTYFRRAFIASGPATFTNLTVRLLRDDGGIVYLNGTEVFRSNMATGVVNHLTTASNALPSDETTDFYSASISPALLLNGTNLLAVEIHQANATSSDLSFDLALTGLAANGTPMLAVANGPAANVTDISADLGGVRTAFNAVPTTATLFWGRANGGTNTANWEGSVTLTNVNLGAFVATATGLLPGSDYFSRSRAANPYGEAWAANSVTFTTRMPTPVTMIAAGAVWKYLDTGWIAPGFDDTAWASGPAELGYGDIPDGRPEATVVSYGTNANNKFITTYFRQTFHVPDASLVRSLNARLIRDDGAVVYLNGAEVWRDNMPTGTVTFTTLAASTASGTAESNWFTRVLAPAALVDGWNSLAVEVHQDRTNSSDLSFNFELSGITYIASAPTLAIAASGPQLTLAWSSASGPFSLYSATNLAPSATWSRMTNEPSLLGQQWQMALPLTTNGQRFYRLQAP